MTYFSRLGFAAVALASFSFQPALCGAACDPCVGEGTAEGIEGSASTPQLITVGQDTQYMMHSSQGYLGVNLREVDNEAAQRLKISPPHGAEIVLVDQDAPAAKAGFRVHDVIVEMNGQRIEGIEQLRRMLHETPPGRTVAFVIIRDGNPANISVQLADRMQVEQDAWKNRIVIPPPGEPVGQGLLSGGAASPGGIGVWSLTMGSFSPGATVHPLSDQMAGYFGVKSGLMVESVDKGSAAANAGLKAHDVILKVNDESMVTQADWTRTLRANLGKSVQVTILRDKKQETLTMQIEGKKKGDLEWQEIFPEFSLDDDVQVLADARVAINPADITNQLRLLNRDAIREQRKAICKQQELMRKETREVRRSVRQMTLNANEMNHAILIDQDELRGQIENSMPEHLVVMPDVDVDVDLDIDVDSVSQQVPQLHLSPKAPAMHLPTIQPAPEAPAKPAPNEFMKVQPPPPPTEQREPQPEILQTINMGAQFDGLSRSVDMESLVRGAREAMKGVDQEVLDQLSPKESNDLRKKMEEFRQSVQMWVNTAAE